MTDPLPLLRTAREALEPFARVVNWANRCAEQDRDLGLRDFSIHLETHAFSSGYSLLADDFKRARSALSALDAALAGGAGALVSERDTRQAVVVKWGAKCFGDEHMADKIVRAARFFEEAAELAQAVGLPQDHALRAFRHVYSRPAGTAAQEAGGVGVTLMALCHALGLSADECEVTEITRCLSKSPESFAARNRAKIEQVDTPSNAGEAPGPSTLAAEKAVGNDSQITAGASASGRGQPAPYTGPPEKWREQVRADVLACVKEMWKTHQVINHETLAREVADCIPTPLTARDDGWRPIETAPKDGTSVLLAAHLESFQGTYDPDKGRWHLWNTEWVVTPTDWRPLPPPPAEEPKP